MIVFHGSNIAIEHIDLDLCKPYKDFGKGFYTTELERQAVNMAKRTVKQFGGKPYVTQFTVDDAEFQNCVLIKKIFTAPTNEWALFVINNRNRNYDDIAGANCNLDNKYDIVIGPVANDDLRFLFDLFEDKILTINELSKRLEYKKLTSQISFHSVKAVRLLNKIEAYQL